MVCGYGTIEGAPAFAFAQNPDVSGGAMGLAQSKKIQRIYDLAFKNGMPVIGIYDSKGAHIDEGLDVLHAFTGLIHSANMLSGVVPQISLIMGMCTGSNAVLASLADISVICEGARMSLNPPSIYEKPEKIGSAKSAYENGSVQMLVKDENECVEAARKLLRLLPQNNLSPLPGADGGHAFGVSGTPM